MTIPRQDAPHFDLWTENWITLQKPDGAVEALGLEGALRRAHEFRAILEPSPLIVVGVHRLLTAIAQAALDPRSKGELKRLWDSSAFPAEPLSRFAAQYGHRFDLFSPDEPFLQSCDLPLAPAKGDSLKTVAQLTPEVPAGSNATHFRHGLEARYLYCSACAAGGLAAVPAFAISEGRTFRPSINGVPPIYVLPAAKTLFHRLVASLMLPEYQPQVASCQQDLAWWTRPALVPRSAEALEVGYLHSLTFPARRVRLHPTRMTGSCTRCGRRFPWGVSTMVFEMGESRPKDAPFWFDPFCAYRLRPKDSPKPPLPVRPTAGKATWREFASLFLQAPRGEEQERTIRPRVLDQTAALGLAGDEWVFPVRCIGLRTDMKAKVFEWTDAAFEIPAGLLADESAGLTVEDALSFAGDCATKLRGALRSAIGGSGKTKRNESVTNWMSDELWSGLATPFREFIVELARDDAPREQVLRTWTQCVEGQARSAFLKACALVGDNAASLRQRVDAERRMSSALFKLKRDFARQQGWEEANAQCATRSDQ